MRKVLLIALLLTGCDNNKPLPNADVAGNIANMRENLPKICAAIEEAHIEFLQQSSITNIAEVITMEEETYESTRLACYDPANATQLSFMYETQTALQKIKGLTERLRQS